MNLYVITLITVFELLIADNVGVAEIQQLQDHFSRQRFVIYFELVDDAVVMYSSFNLPDSYTVTWQIHELPVKMGSQSCSNLLLGGCFECSQSSTDGGNQPIFDEKMCIKGDNLSTARSKLSDCARIRGKDGLIGRSVVLRVQSSSNSPSQYQLYCATIYEQNNTHPDFTSTIAWFNKPYAGFVAFRKESSTTTYIIVNLTRTVDVKEKGEENLKWEIRKNSIDHEELYDPGNKTNTQDYNSLCSVHKSHENCAEGDLWKKHNRIKLKNNLQINLNMFVDNNLDLNFDTSMMYLVLLNTSKDNVEQVVASALLSVLQPISVKVSFMGGSVWTMNQRDDWSAIQQWYEPSSQNQHGSWVVTIFKVPTIQIFGGDQWSCEDRWSDEIFLPEFETSKTKSYLAQLYTLYGRNSMMYRGVSVKRVDSHTHSCSSISYPQDQERVAFGKLENDNQIGDHKLVVVVIEHAILRQTTVLVATLCRSSQFFLELTEAEDCSKELYNPFAVCPAVCETPIQITCNAKCSDQCCSMCVYNSSYLCPLGDLRRRLGKFSKTSKHKIKNTEKVFNVKNAVDLPLDQMINRYIGQKVFNTQVYPELTRCGQVQELEETVVLVDNIIDGNVSLTQKAAWQPLTVNWKGIKLKSIKFWDFPQPNTAICPSFTTANKETYVYMNFPRAYEMTDHISHTLPKEEKSPTFFGPDSVLGKSVTIWYENSRLETKTTTFNIKAHNTDSENLQAIFLEDNTRMLKFDFEQRKGHLTEDTYITVQVLNKKYCMDKMIKWYIINKDFADSFVIGDSFILDSYDNAALWHEKNDDDCWHKSPHQLFFGDLSGRLGNIELKRLDKIYVHVKLPLIKVKGHYLVLTNETDTILGKMELLEAQRLEPPVDETAANSAPSSQVYIIVSVIVGIAVLILGSVIVMKICNMPQQNTNSSNYQTLPTDHPISKTEPRREICTDKKTGKSLYLHPDKIRMYEVLTEDPHTGMLNYRHPHELQLMSDQESDPSTNGSSLRSQRTVAEGNLYSNLSPPLAGHPQMIVVSPGDSPDSSHSSLSSRDKNSETLSQ